MRLRWSILLLCAVLAAPVARAQTDDEVEARRIVLDLAGAFSNDGFKIRDGNWAGTLQPQQRELIAVNLYAGNQYWFSVGGSKAKKLAIDLYDETGRQVTTEHFDGGEKAAAGFSPTASGQYFVAVSLVEGDAGSVCLVYCYK